jgi:hypothetical protein
MFTLYEVLLSMNSVNVRCETDPLEGTIEVEVRNVHKGEGTTAHNPA